MTGAHSANAFIREKLALVRLFSAEGLHLRRSLGPVTFHIVGSGRGLTVSEIDNLLRYAAHTRPDETLTACTLYLCNGESSVLGLPPATWPLPICDAASFHRTHWSSHDGLALASDEQHGVWVMADLPAREMVIWMRDIQAMPEWEETAPLRHCFHWSAHGLGAVVAHTAVFGEADRYALVTGPGGTGKSTLTLAASCAGLGVIAEDLCWVDLQGNQPIARRLYDNIKISPASFQRMNAIERSLYQVDQRAFAKVVLRLPEQSASAGLCRALFCLSGRFGEETIIRKCSKAMAYRMLAPSTVFLMRTALVETSGRLKRLVDMLPTFELSPAFDAGRTAAAVMTVIHEYP